MNILDKIACLRLSDSIWNVSKSSSIIVLNSTNFSHPLEANKDRAPMHFPTTDREDLIKDFRNSQANTLHDIVVF